jgi:hypothetical protein
MRLRRSLERGLAAGLLILLAGACGAETSPPSDRSPTAPPLGLMGTIPIYWGEEAEFGDALTGEAKAHWARNQLEARFALRPLDTLTPETLSDLDFLLLAQPRALAPAENVALDAWVRDGGRVLLFADPLLTGESRFAIGDRRRPQDVVLLSPILTHWGLRLEFDDAQPAAPSLRNAEVPIPVHLPGRFAIAGGEGACTLDAGDVVARCRVGEGQVVALADAAVLDLYQPDPAAPDALAWLVEQGFGDLREIAGNPASRSAAAR